MGAFRNSEQNSYGGAMQFFVSRDGNAQAFRARADPTAPGANLAAMLASRARAKSMLRRVSTD